MVDMLMLVDNYILQCEVKLTSLNVKKLVKHETLKHSTFSRYHCSIRDIFEITSLLILYIMLMILCLYSNRITNISRISAALAFR